MLFSILSCWMSGALLLFQIILLRPICTPIGCVVSICQCTHTWKRIDSGSVRVSSSKATLKSGSANERIIPVTRDAFQTSRMLTAYFCALVHTNLNLLTLRCQTKRRRGGDKAARGSKQERMHCAASISGGEFISVGAM